MPQQLTTVSLSVNAATGQIVKRKGGVIFDGLLQLSRQQADRVKFTCGTPFALFLVSYLRRNLFRRGAIPRATPRFASPFAPAKRVYESDRNDELELTVTPNANLGEYSYALAVLSGSRIYTLDPRIIIE